MADLLILDVDGTLIRSFMREGAPKADYDLVEVLPGREQKLRGLAADGYRFAIATNQAGVAMGYQTVERVLTKLGRVVALFEFFYGQPFTVHYCFEHPHARIEQWRGDSARRKPKAGMLLEAMRAHHASPSKLTFVGDMESDRLAAESVGMAYRDAAEFFGP